MLCLIWLLPIMSFPLAFHQSHILPVKYELKGLTIATNVYISANFGISKNIRLFDGTLK